MQWRGVFFGAVIGLLVTRGRVFGAVCGALVGLWFDLKSGRPGAAHGARAAQAVSEVFFRATFLLMGHVAKSDGRVSEAEIGAARGIMHALGLGAREVALAIEYFTAGKSAGFDVHACVEELHAAFGLRPDLARAFMDLQLRAAVAGNGLPEPARALLTRVAERLGVSRLEFSYMEAAARARRSAHAGGAGGAGGAGNTGGAGRTGSATPPLAECYAELEANERMSDREITKAYRRQMSRHHPDKLVANGLPESMMQVAKEKTQRIQEAYEVIRAARGMR